MTSHRFIKFAVGRFFASFLQGALGNEPESDIKLLVLCVKNLSN